MFTLATAMLVCKDIFQRVSDCRCAEGARVETRTACLTVPGCAGIHVKAKHPSSSIARATKMPRMM